MHHVLERQIRRYLGERVAISPEWRAFFESVSTTYAHFDEDRAFLNRSLDLSSKKFPENNSRLEEIRVRTEKQAQILALQVAKRTKELYTRIGELEDVRKAMTNLLEDFEEKQQALAKAKAKAKDEALLASIGDGMFATDKEGRIVAMNYAAEKMLGCTKEAFLGKKFFNAFENKDASGNVIPPEKQPMSIALATGKKFSSSTTTPANTIYYVRKDGTQFPVALTVTPVIFNGQIVGIIDIFRDITREIEIDKAKTEFVSLASHQLRTPLSTISWYTEMLLTGDAGKLKIKQKKYLEEVYKGNRRMVDLVNALLNVSRLELGTFEVEPEPTDVAKLARSVANEQGQQIEAKKLKFSEQYANNLPRLNADPKLLRMVFQNLLSNAIKYTPDKGSVSVDIHLVKNNELVADQNAKEDSIAIVVSDTGYGIPKNQQREIFTKLFRADNVREKNTEGTGLGLYIIKSIIDHSDGKIWFVSQENKGTTFYILLPLTGMKKKEATKELA